jgi:glycosyltransferase involved in cell wall biosynthesis
LPSNGLNPPDTIIMKDMKPLVSIICITYNQREFIKEALDSFLMQKTEFSVEILIHDDASIDGTKEIIEQYQSDYPQIIRPFFEKTNQYSTGDFSFINKLYEAAMGKYIAFCEGDDFWTDPEKLARQVSYMEARPTYALCFHSTRVFFQNGEKPDYIYPDPSAPRNYDLQNLLQQNYVQSNSVLYRRVAYKDVPSDVIPSDWYMHLYHAQYGKIGFIDRTMSAYRRQAGGVWWEAHNDLDAIWKKYGIQHLKLFVELNKLYGAKPAYRQIIDTHINNMFDAIVRTDKKFGQGKLALAVREFPEGSANYVLALTAQKERAIKDLKHHAGEQAVIIEHLKRETETLETKNRYLRSKLQLRIEDALKRRVGKKSSQ